MTKNRRDFIGQLSLLAGVAALSRPINAIASVNKFINNVNNPGANIAIYHTGHLLGNINAAHNGMGGLNQVKALMLNDKKAGLWVDAGNFLGKGQSRNQHLDVINLMNGIGYHAAVISQHELVNGVDYLAGLAPEMKFALVNCNYRFTGELNKLVKPYIIVNSGHLKIGITGVGQQTKHTGYEDAVASANRVAAYLKNNQKCNLVVCLSALEDETNVTLAKESEHIDMIIGGENAGMASNPLIRLNKLKNDVILSKATSGGLMVGKTTFTYTETRIKQNVDARYLIPGKAENEKFASAYQKLRANWQTA